MPKIKLSKVLVLGSGATKIGEAGEFDYSGSQAIKALKEEGIQTILVNPNIATMQTNEKFADKVYFLPVNTFFVKKIIEKEKPDGILLGFGGQTALNCGLELEANGILAKNNVTVLGTSIAAIKDTEDRELFSKKLGEIQVKTPKSIAVNSVEDALDASEKIGFPIMIRSGYALGGLGSSLILDKKSLEEKARVAFAHSPQILVEEYLSGWKEIEYEVVRDSQDNCITVCNMENFDPLGIHTGESIVVSPSQTLTNEEYHRLREISIKTIRHLGIIGECNIQFALDPEKFDYRVIEVNARLSRSSALASKATGYPLAFVAAKLALGYDLNELKNSITKVTTACFEPALDYVVVKIPRWDLKKFRLADRKIGTQMKSVGEVMAIGRKFEEALQKAIRMLDIGANGLIGNGWNCSDVESELKKPSDDRVFYIPQAIKAGYSIDKIYSLTKIDKWFLHKIKNIIDSENHLKKELNEESLLEAKQNGFSDKQIAKIVGKTDLEIMELRKSLGIRPCVKQIDSLAAEFPAKTNYLYLTYNGTQDDIEFGETKQVMVLGSGTYRIGSSVEFDWCCVNSVNTLKQLGYKTIMVNYNPETVSTDYDTCDKLYFDEISLETILEIYEKENPLGVIVSSGGQTPNNLALKLAKQEVKILGTTPKSIDIAEDRNKFSKLLDTLQIAQPAWREMTQIDEAKKFSSQVGYPVLIRPSYVLSGAAMNVAFEEKDLEAYLTDAVNVNTEYPVVISKFITNSKEIEIDAVAKNGEIVAKALTEHVENAGVHSGDATIVYPAKSVYVDTVKKAEEIAEKISRELEITGPFNIQFLAKGNDVKVIECNLRASRSFPFVSKVSKTNFIEIATRAIMGAETPKKSTNGIKYVGVKAPQFSFSRLKGADPILRVEMTSTGEVACLGADLHEAFLKSIMATGFKLPKKSVMLSIGGEDNKYKIMDSVLLLDEMGFEVYATKNTSEFLSKHGIENILVKKIHEKSGYNALDLIRDKKVELVINIPSGHAKEQLDDQYTMRRKAVDYSIPLITNLQLAKVFIEAIYRKKPEDLKIKSWDEYR